MESNKGITLAALVITIIVTLILAGTATYVGYDAIQTSNEQRFLSQLKEVNEAVNLHTEDYKELGLVQLETEVTFNDNSYNYKLESKEDYEKIGLSNVEDTIYVNFDTGQIYSENGINGKHTLEDFGVEYYKPTQENITEQNNISFDIKLEPQQYSWKYIVNDSSIICDGNVQDGNLFYSEYIDGIKHSWKRVERVSDGFALEIKQPGIYEIKFRDSLGNESEIKQVYAYVKDGLQLYYDGEYNENYKHNSEATTWTDLSGNENDGVLKNFTFDENSKWLENALLFNATNNYVYLEKIKGDETNQKTVEFLDVDGELCNNEKLGMLFEFSEDLNENKSAFGVDINEYNNRMSLTVKGSSSYNIKGTKEDILKPNKTSNYSFIVNNDNKYNDFIELYINSIKSILEEMNMTENISGLKLNNYSLYIASRSGKQYFTKIRLGCFRIYNRALTDDEIKKNYEIDKIRYNISE